ncbi:unnamed protein product [Rotaria sordida]|uniref:Uncharacterized protein n=1 Tax=Rotaria sordida TaxID=392033 RepID=A0A815BJG2_9BILA|nr:unnamed protein product [Rotaria sordida]CAF1357279.1 unnamed protein product [Rotaria sordida]CAF1426555.1 unnamed protein product [Rotaria sordida]CAF1548032.1 unnamed protein product [Rotaria sordida]CAF3797362.1 unnamed protein product [Rotaria sordida]
MICMQIILIILTTIPYGILNIYSLVTIKTIKDKNRLNTESLVFTIISLNTFIHTSKKCSTDDDCDLELMCNIESHTCTRPQPYFWHEDIRACYGCASSWLKLQANKCLLFAISHSSGVIYNMHEFTALQDQIKYLLNGNVVLIASLYFYQGVWVRINNVIENANNINEEQLALALSTSGDDSSNKDLNDILSYGDIAAETSNSITSFTSVVSQE